MLTLDDCNTILEKYGKIGFWYEIDLTQFTEIGTYQQDFVTIERGESYWHVTPISNLSESFGYGINMNGEFYFLREKVFGTWPIPDSSNIHFLYLLTNIPAGTQSFREGYELIPDSQLQIKVHDGHYNDKFYFKYVPRRATITLDREAVELYEDETGKYIMLPSDNDCVLGLNIANQRDYFWVRFIRSKELPVLSVNTLYKGTSQTITLYDNTNDRTVTDFQASYNGRKLKDNKIELPYGAEDIIDLVIELTDPLYPETRLKLKAPTAYCVCTSQAEVETAISKGVQTMIVDNNGTSVVLDEMILEDILFINSKITVNESTLTNCKILRSQYIDNGKNTLTNTEIDGTAITGDHKSTYTDCTINDSTITDMEIHISGAITNSIIEDSLIITDNPITLTGNTFNGGYDKTYFPSVLYLTGEYTIKRNVFTLEAEYTEPEFNMCLIKAVTFNPNQFIIDNILNLNITYEDEDPETLYYNIVDDDKIKAVKL